MPRIVLLIHGEKSYLAAAEAEINTQFGRISTKGITGKKLPTIIKSSTGEEFIAMQPAITDFLRKAGRGPQIIAPKDIGALIGAIGIAPGWRVLDAGTGSGFLSMFLANIVYPGTVYTYEKSNEFFKIAEKNIKKFGFTNIILKNEDVFNAKEQELDLVTLDMEGAEKFVKIAHEKLRPGGWLVVYSLHIEQVQAVFKEMKKYYSQLRIFETLQRDWQIEGTKKLFTRPRTHMLAHTGWWVIGRRCD